jgi:TetR/AcrR family transcriptional regulator
MAMPTPSGGTKSQILAAAMRHFAADGYAATRLNDIADDVGIRRPSLLHHFPSKDALYRAVLLESFADWFALVEKAIESPTDGWPQCERILRAAFQFFEDHPEFVRLARREALDGGPMLFEELGAALRPLFRHAVTFLKREMKAGRLRQYDARQVIFDGYGAALSYLSDAPLISVLTNRDPLTHRALGERREHVIELLRNALAP